MTSGIVYWYFAPNVLGSAQAPLPLPPGLVKRHNIENLYAEVAGAAFMELRNRRPDLVPASGRTIAVKDSEQRWQLFLVTPNEGCDGTWVVEGLGYTEGDR